MSAAYREDCELTRLRGELDRMRAECDRLRSANDILTGSAMLPHRGPGSLCVKCNNLGARVTVTYRPGRRAFLWFKARPEAIRCRCSDCGAVWHEYTADANPVAR